MGPSLPVIFNYREKFPEISGNSIPMLNFWKIYNPNKRALIMHGLSAFSVRAKSSVE